MNILKDLQRTRAVVKEKNILRMANNLIQSGRHNDLDSFYEEMGKRKSTNELFKHWEAYGCKAFNLTEEMLGCMRNTDIPTDVTIDHVPLPFDSFIITSENPLIDISSCKELDSMRLRYLLCLSFDFYHDVCGKIESEAMDETMKSCGYNRNDISSILSIIFRVTDGTLTSNQIFLPYDTTFGKYLNNVFNDEFLSDSEEDASYTIEIFKEAFKLFCNTVLYINDKSRHPETESVVRKRVKKPGGGYQQTHQIYLRRQRFETLRTPSLRKLDKRFIVRGHWKNQACGKNWSERRLIWVPPFWKGPSTAEIVSNPHKVD